MYEAMCPFCQTYTATVCEEGCGTYYCPDCDLDFRVQSNGKYREGHKTSCPCA